MGKIKFFIFSDVTDLKIKSEKIIHKKTANCRLFVLIILSSF